MYKKIRINLNTLTLLFGNNWTQIVQMSEQHVVAIHLAYNIIIYYIYKYIASTPDGKSQVVRYCEISV